MVATLLAVNRNAVFAAESSTELSDKSDNLHC
jgi:hypothetical protein